MRVKFGTGSTRGVILRAVGNTMRLLRRANRRPRTTVSGIAAPNNYAVGNLGAVRRNNFADTIVGNLLTKGEWGGRWGVQL